MFILILLIVMIATTVITMLMRPHNGPVASSLGDFNFPTATEGRAIPVAFGTVKIGGGNTVWWGNLKTIPIQQGSFFSKTTVGFKYLISVQYVLCQGQIDEFISLECDGKQVPFSFDDGALDPRRVFIDQDMFWGGTPAGQGGLRG